MAIEKPMSAAPPPELKVRTWYSARKHGQADGVVTVTKPGDDELMLTTAVVDAAEATLEATQ